MMNHQIPIKDRFFESISGTLYCFEKAIIESGLSINYYRKEKSQGNKRLCFIDHPLDSRFSLLAFETISDQHKDKIKLRFGNPYDFVAREPIMKMVLHDNQAEQFFLQHRFNGKSLPIKRVKQYSRAASWLNMLSGKEINKQVKEIGLTVPEFFEHVKALMQLEKDNGASSTYDGNLQLTSDFPTSYVRLTTKRNAYSKEGYALLIDKMNGNQLAAKINDQVSEAQLLFLIEDPRQFDDVMVSMLYNTWASQNNYKTIDPSTVGVWRRKKGFEITMGREGNSSFNEKYIRQVKGLKPSHPLALVEHDDNNLDFLFLDGKNPYNRYVSIVVVDSCCGLVLGKSYTRITENMEDTMQKLIVHAYIDAMYYIRSLTKDNNWYLPLEFKSDKWALKSLTPFYNKIGHFIIPSHGNKHRGYIEQFFGSPIWKRSQKLVSQGNHNGNNMTAKYAGVNKEALDANSSNRPMIGKEAELQIENFFHLLRHMPDFKREEMDALSKEEQWLKAWNELPAEKRRPISDEQFLLTFGVEHNSERPITITNRGVEPQITNGKYSYDLPEPWMYNKLIGAKVNVIYDPFDMSRVLITNHKDIRFIARTAQLQPRALQDQYTGSRTYLNAILEAKKDQVQKVSTNSSKRKQVVDVGYYNAEAIVQGGVMIKELKMQAEQKLIEGTNGTAFEDDVFDRI
jgi:hypothetical protein